ncbi:MAG: glycoside hydrolase family 30 beta sandwich domain-containing protein, partial [Candidatus Bathyarchaeia archaeon]
VKQFFKFISPGSVRVEARSDRPQILASAYLNEESGDITIVLINRGMTDVNAKISLKNITPSLTLKQYRTSRNENCKYIDNIVVRDGLLEVLLPSDSITTLTTR